MRLPIQTVKTFLCLPQKLSKSSFERPARINIQMPFEETEEDPNKAQKDEDKVDIKRSEIKMTG